MTLPVRLRPVRILCAEDDADDRDLVRDALRESRLPNELRFVKDGEELMEYLAFGNFGDPTRPRPDIIFLDLWMPKKDGREALREIKANPSLRPIPVVVISTSRAEEDVVRSYDLGASSFVRKSSTFDAFVDVMTTIGKYWFEVVDLPRTGVPTTTTLESAPRSIRVLVLEGEPASWPVSLELPNVLAVRVGANDSAEAIRHLARDHSIEAVVVDLALPGGRQAVAAIRARRPRLPILALSKDVFDAGAAILAGANGFLEKPCAPAELERALRAIL